MDALLLEPDVRRKANEADLLSLVAELREEIAGLRREVSELRCEVGYWKSRHADAVKRNEKLEQDLAVARAEIRQLKADRFGKKSEKHDRSNRLDDPQGEDATLRRGRGQQPSRPGPARRDYSHLPVRETFLELPPAACVCERCGKPLVDLGDTEDSEQVELEIAVFRRRLRRRRYRRTCDCPGPQTRTAPQPPKLIPKGRYGLSLWIHLLLEKFHAQRPIQRTIEQLRWHGLELAPGTIVNGLKCIEPLLAPIYAAMRERSAGCVYHQADETRWLVFVEKEGKKSHRWWLWVFAGEDSVVYMLDPSRSHEVPEAHLPADVPGVLMVDRYSAYKAMKQVQEGRLRLAFCWAHVRRDFVRVGKAYPELKAWALVWLRLIRELYRLARERHQAQPLSAKHARADAVLRQQIITMEQQRDSDLANAKLREPCRKALVSLNEHWSGLTLFLDDPRIPLDNNYAERLMRNPAVGRKNYYGSGAEWAGRLAMMMFSIVATLKLWNINPRLWLAWYLEACANARGQAPPHVESYLPWNLSDDQRAALVCGSKQPTRDDSS
jgi:transposase